MKFTYEFYKKYRDNVYNTWEDKTFLSLIYLKHYGIISHKSFVSLTNSILKGNTPERRGTFYFREMDKWFNDEYTQSIYDYGVVCSSRKDSIDMEDMIKYVSLITGQPRNYTINTIFDIFVKPLLLFYTGLELDNHDYGSTLSSLFNVDFKLGDEKSFLYVYDGDAFERGYSEYRKHEVNYLLKSKFQEIAKEYYKGKYYLNPLYVEGINFDGYMSDSEHIFEILVPWGVKSMDSLKDTQYR